jgi:hypothetical protein
MIGSGMRSLLLLPGLALAGCGSPDRQAAAAEEERILCRIGEAAAFERLCTVEQGESEAGRTLTVRKPDGGFRRLLVTGDGSGVEAADGAEEAQVTIVDADTIEVAIGGDAFRLPATVRAP